MTETTEERIVDGFRVHIVRQPGYDLGLWTTEFWGPMVAAYGYCRVPEDTEVGEASVQKLYDPVRGKDRVADVHFRSETSPPGYQLAGIMAFSWERRDTYQRFVNSRLAAEDKPPIDWQAWEIAFPGGYDAEAEQAALMREIDSPDGQERMVSESIREAIANLRAAAAQLCWPAPEGIAARDSAWAAWEADQRWHREWFAAREGIPATDIAFPTFIHDSDRAGPVEAAEGTRVKYGSVVLLAADGLETSNPPLRWFVASDGAGGRRLGIERGTPGIVERTAPVASESLDDLMSALRAALFGENH